MRVAPLLFVLFFTVPIVEIYLLIRVGGVIGALPTVGLILLTALIGSWMLRIQGLSTLRRARTVLDSGQAPARELIEGLILLVSGVLLLTPGFVTDALGFAGLLPAVRGWAARRALERMVVHVAGEGGSPPPPADRPGARVIEGEWEREDGPDRRGP